jgi:hypothetical protein
LHLVTGLEHCLPQLADFHPAPVGQSVVDHAQPEKGYAQVLTSVGHLRPAAAPSPVHLLLGPDQRGTARNGRLGQFEADWAHQTRDFPSQTPCRQSINFKSSEILVFK